MKTTLELSDDLLRRTKAAAALRGVSMRDFIAESLESRLQEPGRAGWRAVAGKARKLDTAPVKRALAKEFSRIDEEGW